MKDALGERVSEVRNSTRLKDSPAVLVLGEDELGANMRRVLQAAGQKLPESKPALELNVAHPLVKYMDAASDGEQFAELAQLLYDQAALAEGGPACEPRGVRAAAESRTRAPHRCAGGGAEVLTAARGSRRKRIKENVRCFSTG